MAWHLRTDAAHAYVRARAADAGTDHATWHAALLELDRLVAAVRTEFAVEDALAAPGCVLRCLAPCRPTSAANQALPLRYASLSSAEVASVLEALAAHQIPADRLLGSVPVLDWLWQHADQLAATSQNGMLPPASGPPAPLEVLGLRTLSALGAQPAQRLQALWERLPANADVARAWLALVDSSDPAVQLAWRDGLLLPALQNGGAAGSDPVRFHAFDRLHLPLTSILDVPGLVALACNRMGAGDLERPSVAVYALDKVTHPRPALFARMRVKRPLTPVRGSPSHLDGNTGLDGGARPDDGSGGRSAGGPRRRRARHARASGPALGP